MKVEQKRNMMGTLKEFDKNEHSLYDSKGKQAMISYLNSTIGKEYTNVENPNNYGIDLLTLNKDNEVVYCWEIEVRYGNWYGDRPFPFREINCIERKDYQWRRDQSFLDKIPYNMATEYKVCYVQMNKECNRAVIIDGDDILKYPLKQWANRKADNEYVRQVPITSTIQVVLDK